MSRLKPSERKLVESLVAPAAHSSTGFSFVPRTMRGGTVVVREHFRRYRRRRVPVELARALYRMFGDWNKVAEALPGKFLALSIKEAVQRHDRAKRAMRSL